MDPFMAEDGTKVTVYATNETLFKYFRKHVCGKI